MLTMRESITFANEGQKLIGVLHRPARPVTPDHDKAPAVVLFHGFTGTKVERHRIFVKTAEALAREGIVALRFDFRGSGDSEGDFEDMTLPGEISDARASLDYASGLPGVDGNNLGILGLSMGGAVAACVSDDPRVRSVVLWSAVADLEATFLDAVRSGAWREAPGSGVTGAERPGPAPGQPASPGADEATGKSPEGHGNEHIPALAAFAIPRRVDVKGNVVGREFILTLTEARPLETVQRCKAPVLVIHGDRDESVPVSHSAMYERAIKEADGTVEVHIVAGADHTFNSAVWEAEVLSKTVAWFKRSLL
ncbi:MAG: alpha/beta hydrolase [Firmicutes bacterium]|jgi:dipeptidyl aminopeptidase/acylaminoacyl peptidase|nr:alpha/beta hydrolase [Bacillota bacterium]MDH7495302.1 alpha/beta hydrolase [Bacillota bacterium]